MRGAFEGLAARVSSVSEQGSALERSFEHAGRSDDNPIAFSEKTYSFDDVAKTDGVSHVAPSTQAFELHNESKSFSRVESAEFFNYLTAIGGV